jgi:FkbM family methyltransferase
MSNRFQPFGKMIATAARRVIDIPAEIHKLGAGTAVKIYTSWLLHPPYFAKAGTSAPRIGTLQLKGYRYPFFFRHGTSDVRVIRQIFLKEEYRDLSHEDDVRWIIDCGANIGCSAFYFLSKYPQARLVAIEPDEGNFRLLRRNLEPWGERALVVQGGIWSSDQRLRVDRGHYGDGKEWSYQVRACREGEEADVTAFGLETIRSRFHCDQVDLLKIDIERAEIQVFGSSYGPWLSRTRNLAIELHGPDCERVFMNAMAGYEYQLERSGELTICRNIRGLPAATARRKEENI